MLAVNTLHTKPVAVFPHHELSIPSFRQIFVPFYHAPCKKNNIPPLENTRALAPDESGHPLTSGGRLYSLPEKTGRLSGKKPLTFCEVRGRVSNLRPPGGAA